MRAVACSPDSRPGLRGAEQEGSREVADEEYPVQIGPKTFEAAAQADTQRLHCGLRLRGGGQGISRETPLTPEARERGDAAYEHAQSALAADDAYTPRGVTERELGRVDTAVCEECEETDAAVAEGVGTPMPWERHSDGVREREGQERVKRGGNTLWQATCHQEVPRYRHPVAVVLTATSNDKGRLYERGNWDISIETRQAIADMAAIDDTETGRKETMTITPVTNKRRNTQTSKKKTLLKASEGIEKMRQEDTATKRKKT